MLPVSPPPLPRPPPPPPSPPQIVTQSWVLEVEEERQQHSTIRWQQLRRLRSRRSCKHGISVPEVDLYITLIALAMTSCYSIPRCLQFFGRSPAVTLIWSNRKGHRNRHDVHSLDNEVRLNLSTRKKDRSTSKTVVDVILISQPFESNYRLLLNYLAYWSLTSNCWFTH